MVFCVYIGSNKQANMNYRQALKKKVVMEKTMRPRIKDYLIPEHTRINNDNIVRMNENKEEVRCLNALMEIRDKPPIERKEMLAGLLKDKAFHVFTTAFLEIGYLDDGLLELIIENQNTTINGLTLAIKQSKKEIIILSYVYNCDVENAEKHYEGWKKMSYMSQEWWEENHEGKGLLFDENKQHLDEDAYLVFMNREKVLYETFASGIRVIREYNNIVKPILKAGRRMNKRNRG